MSKNEISSLLSPYTGRPSDIIEALQDIQRSRGYIPKEALKKAAEVCGVSYSYTYSIATFYKAFSLHEKGMYVLRVCDGTACHLKLSEEIRDELSHILGIGEDETTEDGLFSLELVNCLGACAMAPVVSINEKLFGYLTRNKIRAIVDDIRSRKEEALK